MPSDDELRRVAEDMRALARSLGRDLRAALDRSRVDMAGPGGRPAPAEPADASGDAGSGVAPGRRSVREDLAAARQDLRQAQLAVRQAARRRHHGDHWHDDPEGEDQGGPRRGPGLEPGCPPRWDNWGRQRYHYAAGVRPGGAWSRRPSGPPAPSPGPRERERERVPAPAPAPAPPLRHRHDGSTLLGLLAVVFGMAWLVAGTHLAHVSTEAVIAVALMVLGAATVVTARTDWALSRRSWPVLGGAVLALALLALSASPSLPVGFRHLEFGSRVVAPATWADLPASVHGGFGKTLVDLTQLPLPLPATRTLVVDSAAGRLEINIPPDLPVVVDARAAAGMIDVDGVAISGVNRVDHVVLHASAPGPVLTLQVESGFGSAAVTTIDPSLAPKLDPSAPTAPKAPEAPAGVK